jgi:hypothetical protein
MPQQVRFTPEEIRALMASGELPMDLIRKMHPDDQKVAQAIFNSHDYSQTDGHPASVPEQLAHIGSQVKNHPLAAAGMGAALAVPLATTGALGMGASAIAGELPMMAKVAGYTGLAALGAKMGIPASAMEAVALYMGMKGMGKGAALPLLKKLRLSSRPWRTKASIPSTLAWLPEARNSLSQQGVPPSRQLLLLVVWATRHWTSKRKSLDLKAPRLPRLVLVLQPILRMSALAQRWMTSWRC